MRKRTHALPASNVELCVTDTHPRECDQVCCPTLITPVKSITPNQQNNMREWIAIQRCSPPSTST
jgi:hypothetical protein